MNVLIDNQDFAWLRQFSMLIVEIDEMFDLKDGIDREMIEANLTKIGELLDPNVGDDSFNAKYDFSMSILPEAATLNEEMRILLG